MSDKPEFDPNQPFQVADKPAFDPSQPFQEVGGEKSQGFLEREGRNVVDKLPLIGGMVGGVLGTPADVLAGPMGNIAGAAAGGYLGTATKNLINSYIDPDKAPKTTAQAITQPIVGGVQQGGLQAGGELIGAIAAPALSKISQPVSDYLAKLAEKKAVAATGATGVQATKFAPDAGRQLLDRGIVGFGNSQAQIARKAGQAIEESGQGISDSLKSMDEQGVKVDENRVLNYLKDKYEAMLGTSGDGKTARALKKNIDDIQAAIDRRTVRAPISHGDDLSPFDTVEMKYGKLGPEQTISTQVHDPVAPDYSSIPTKAIDPYPEMQGRMIRPSVASKMSNIGAETDTANLEAANEYGFNPYDSDVTTQLSPIQRTGVTQNPEIPISASEANKTKFDYTAKWGKPTNAPAADADKMTANAYRQASEDAATAANPDLAAQFKADKDTYHLLEPIATAAEKRAATTAQSPAGGFLDTTASAAGGLVAGGPGALLAPGFRRAIAPRISSAEAVGADWLANIVRASPEVLGKYAGPLTQAAKRGGTSLAATDYILQQTDPQYQRTLQSLKGNGDATQDK